MLVEEAHCIEYSIEAVFEEGGGDLEDSEA